MKYTKADALSVVKAFENHLKCSIKIIDYRYKDFFHYCFIEPIKIDGKIINLIRFRDLLIKEAIDSRFNIPDIDQYIKVCLLYEDNQC